MPSFPWGTIFVHGQPRTGPGNNAGTLQYRLPREICPGIVLLIVLSGKCSRVWTPIPSASVTRGRFHASRKAHLDPWSSSLGAARPSGSPVITTRCQFARHISSSRGSDTVLPGKCRRSPLSSCPGTLTVPAGKDCRPAREGISSAPGRYIVRPGKVYRPTREKLPFSPGNSCRFFLQIFTFARRRLRASCSCLC